MTSLADELMNDLDDLGSGSEPEQEGDEPVVVDRGHAADDSSTVNVKEEEDQDEEDDMTKMIGVVPEGGVKPADELDEDEVNRMEFGEVDSVESVARLYHGKTLKDVLQRIAHYKAEPDPNLASDPDSSEYKLIVQANNLSVEVDNEMLIVHKFIRDHYLARFPELDSLVSAPLPYCRVILALGNGSELQGDIQGILPSGSVMAVKVTAATSKGRELADDEWRRVVEACEMMFGLDRVKRDILDYVESRISLLAPNISAIVGTQTATKILGIAGGLAGLNRIPHSNIYVLGANKRPSSTGFSTASYSVDRLHTGFIYQCPLVQQTRPEDRMKAQRKVGAKVALAARVDFAGSSPRGEFGDLQRDKLEREMERLARPPPKKVTKALPRPDEKKKNRRGGKRARKAKDAYGMTELRKQQNRVKFGEAEEEVGAFDETRGMGMVGSSSGHVRANVGESRSKAKLSKSAKGRIASIKTSGTATSGLATSLAFTPVQGLELVDPSKLRSKVDDANAKWFSDGAFTHVRKGEGIGKPTK
ncbi:hypothetical protein JCM3766R1_005828 [Sporobolomyces carnicolor]